MSINHFDEIGPFGNPDGERAEIDDIMQKFITFGGVFAGEGLSTSPDDFTARIIIGRKGSGKTVYLRRLNAYASKQNDIYADSLQQDIPSTEMVIQFCHYYEENLLTEKWQQLWKICILSSVASHLINNHRLNESIKDSNISNLLSLLKEVYNERISSCLSVFHFFKSMISKYTNKNSLNRALNNPIWDELENELAILLPYLPPICIYIDSLDDRFKNAPMYWVRCQQGLFLQVMRLLNDSRIGGRLHIFVTIRDIVFTSICEGENSVKYWSELHVRKLHWNEEAIKYFLERKIEMLPSKFLIAPEEGNCIKGWLGINTIKNGRGSREKVINYLIRHTRCIPRDIVVIGNKLCHLVQKAQNKKLQSIPRKWIREAVALTATKFADEQLSICANQVSSDLIPLGAAEKGYSDFYTSVEEYIISQDRKIRFFLKSIDKERFGIVDMINIQNLFSNDVGQDIDLFSVLWQNGLVGYVDNRGKKEIVIFKNNDKIEDFLLPKDKGDFIFHSCLLHSLDINYSGKKPINSAEL